MQELEVDIAVDISGTSGAARAVSAADRLEIAAAQGDFDEARSLLPACRDEVRQLLVALRQFLSGEANGDSGGVARLK